MQFQGFKPQSLKRIANTLGYNGDMAGFNDYLSNNHDKQTMMNTYNKYAMQMAKGGMVRNYAEGGLNFTIPGSQEDTENTQDNENKVENTGNVTYNNPMGDLATSDTMDRRYDPSLPKGVDFTPTGIQTDPGQFVGTDVGAISGGVSVDTTTADTATAVAPDKFGATYVDTKYVSDDIGRATETFKPVQGTVSTGALVNAAQMDSTAVLDMEAAQGEAYLMKNPVQRSIQEGELLDPAASAGQAQKAAKFTEQIQAATASPSERATVQGQLNSLMEQFEGGNTPSWAAGAMRNVSAQMAARGLSASSLAGQAMIQAAMESALPIAAQDAGTFATFEQQNLSNRQQRAMLAAQQRAQFIGQEFDQAFQARVYNASKISDIANMNFTAEQQVALENSRAVNSMNLANLNNRQAKVMADVAAVANMEMANLNNRQAAAVQNAQAFLQMDMANLSNAQQTETIKQQSIINGLLSDAAAENVTRQINAASENDVNKFFASLEASIAQTNVAQVNAQNRFNAGEENVISRFLAEMSNERDMFEANRALLIEQNNVTWRRNVATADTAAINRSNELEATALLDISDTAYNNLWNYYSDTMEWAWTSAENERERETNVLLQQLANDGRLDTEKFKANYQSSASMGGFVIDLLTSDVSKSFLGKLFGL